MAVYTEVSFQEAQSLMAQLQLGTLSQLVGIHAGIENTNYFATTDQGEFVLTIFERLSAEQLPYYLQLMKHLALRGIPVPDPAADPRAHTLGQLIHTVAGKPAAVVNRLAGQSQMQPQAEHCAELGRVLARMHLAGADFEGVQDHLRGLSWWNQTVPVVLPFLDGAQAALLQTELAYQNHVASSSAYRALRQGPIHADLFRNNVMFEGDRLTGLFDFYFAGKDPYLFDLCVCINDWCIDLDTGVLDPVRTGSLMDAYQSICPLQAAERELLPAMARAAALRFWISRIWDLHLPRDASLLTPHDPSHFERILRERVRHPLTLATPMAPARVPSNSPTPQAALS